MYKPPVEVNLQMKNLMESMEDLIASKIVSGTEFADITVDKEELREALLYDRDQYNIGKIKTTREALLYDRDQYNIGKIETIREVYKIINSVKADILEEIEDGDGNVEGLKLALEAVNEIDDRIRDVIR